ncbi:MAG: SRPBCC family protein [Thermoanaerobaculia bacterium]|nr:SRPBCC family protein [Thermoanaerobaculia bacterium]
MGRITIETFIAAPPERCFDLALDVEAHRQSAAFSGERLVPPGKLSGVLELGDLVAFEGVHFGIRQRFVARITKIDRPRSFTDEMVQGIFRSLSHVHEFHAKAGGTLMRDELEWIAPLGILGRIADKLFLERHMRWFVTTKQQHLKKIAESAVSLE